MAQYPVEQLLALLQPIQVPCKPHHETKQGHKFKCHEVGCKYVNWSHLAVAMHENIEHLDLRDARDEFMRKQLSGLESDAEAAVRLNLTSKRIGLLRRKMGIMRSQKWRGVVGKRMAAEQQKQPFIVELQMIWQAVAKVGPRGSGAVHEEFNQLRMAADKPALKYTRFWQLVRLAKQRGLVGEVDQKSSQRKWQTTSTYPMETVEAPTINGSKHDVVGQALPPAGQLAGAPLDGQGRSGTSAAQSIDAPTGAARGSATALGASRSRLGGTPTGASEEGNEVSV